MKLRHVDTLTYSTVSGIFIAIVMYNDKKLDLKIGGAILWGIGAAGAVFLISQVLGVGSHSTEEIIEHDKKIGS